MAYRQMDTKAPSYLEDFLDQIDALPTQIKGKFAEMRDMDERARNFMTDADKATSETVRKSMPKASSNEGLKKSYQDVISLQGKALSSAETKVEVAETAFQEVDQVIRHLDEKLRDFETQLRKEGRWPASSADKPPRPSGSSTGVVTGAGTSMRGTASVAAAQPKSRRSSGGGSARGSGSTAGGNASSGRAQKADLKEPDMQLSVVEDMQVDPDEPRYCYCNQISYGEMVMCETEDCPHQWFHFTCVGLTEAPSGSWQCPECKKKEKDRRKSDG